MNPVFATNGTDILFYIGEGVPTATNVKNGSRYCNRTGGLWYTYRDQWQPDADVETLADVLARVVVLEAAASTYMLANGDNAALPVIDPATDGKLWADANAVKTGITP